MRTLRAVVVTCDNCGRVLARMAPPHTEPTPEAQRRLTHELERFAGSRGWSMEGRSALAGDLCPRCGTFLGDR